jgi:hypothetical protein
MPSADSSIDQYHLICVVFVSKKGFNIREKEHQMPMSFSLIFLHHSHAAGFGLPKGDEWVELPQFWLSPVRNVLHICVFPVERRQLAGASVGWAAEELKWGSEDKSIFHIKLSDDFKAQLLEHLIVGALVVEGAMVAETHARHFPRAIHGVQVAARGNGCLIGGNKTFI